MNEFAAPGKSRPDPGLCTDCVHGRILKSDRSSTFLLCELSFRDPRYPKYPRLPVLSCEGYKKKDREQ